MRELDSLEARPLPGTENAVYPFWSPDSRTIGFFANGALKTIDASGGPVRTLCAAPGTGPGGAWSRDGVIVFASGQLQRLFSVPAAGGQPSQLTVAEGVAPGGYYMNGGAFNTGVLPLAGDRKARVLLPVTFNQIHSQVSPDGRWIAYASNESGRYEVFVQTFPTPGGKWQVSKDGGFYPKWRGDGREIFYYAADGQLMAVPVASGTALEVGSAVPLFRAQMLNGPAPLVGFRAQYDVTPDGQRFLVNVPVEDIQTASITVVLNWAAGLGASR